MASQTEDSSNPNGFYRAFEKKIMSLISRQLIRALYQIRSMSLTAKLIQHITATLRVAWNELARMRVSSFS